MTAYNEYGVSIMLSRTEKGNELLRKIDADRFLIGDADIDIAIQNNRMFDISKTKPSYYDTFEKDFKERGLHYACKNSYGYALYKKEALKNKVKRLIKSFIR